MNLINLLPEFYRGNKTMEELQGILTAQISGLAEHMNEIIDECFINTAASLLSRYERIYGLKVDVSKFDEFRRERIIARIRGIGTVTKRMIEDTARSYSNAEVEIIEDPANSNFKVKFVGTKGLPPNMADLTLTIEEIKPAHLTYTFEFVYRTHNELSGYTNEFLKAYTHNQLREGEM